MVVRITVADRRCGISYVFPATETTSMQSDDTERVDPFETSYEIGWHTYVVSEGGMAPPGRLDPSLLAASVVQLVFKISFLF